MGDMVKPTGTGIGFGANCGVVHTRWLGVPLSRPSPGAYIWLAYSIFFFIEPLLRHELRYWMQCLGIFAIFLVMYVALDVIEICAVKLGILGGFVVLGMTSFPFNPGASTFFLYSACILPFMLERMRIVAALIFLDFVLLAGEGVWLHYPFFSYAFAAFFLLFGGLSNMWMARQKWLNNKLAMAQEEIVQLASVAERERIARDLHDVLGHTLSVIVLKAELAGRLMERDPKRAATEIADVESTARMALAEVREAIGGYRAKGLAAEITRARQTLEAAGVSLAYEESIERRAFDAAEETVLSLAIREAVTNIVRHAEATACSITLVNTPDGFYSLTVEDNGSKVVRREGNGLRGMRERVEGMKGRFRVISAEGTRVIVELPSVPRDEAARQETSNKPLPTLATEQGA